MRACKEGTGALRVTCRQAGRGWLRIRARGRRHVTRELVGRRGREGGREGGMAAVTQRLSIKICWRKGERAREGEEGGRNSVEQ